MKLISFPIVGLTFVPEQQTVVNFDPCQQECSMDGPRLGIMNRNVLFLGEYSISALNWP